MADTIIVFTRKTIDEMLDIGGSQRWRLKPANARQMTYLVCTRNSKGSNGAEQHGAGFLIGRICGVVPTPSKPGRFLVQISEWAPLDCPELWKFGRNPIHYLNLSELGIDPDDLEFEPLGEREHHSTDNGGEPGALTIAEAKQGLALALGVGVDNIEITIRV